MLPLPELDVRQVRSKIDSAEKVVRGRRRLLTCRGRVAQFEPDRTGVSPTRKRSDSNRVWHSETCHAIQYGTLDDRLHSLAVEPARREFRSKKTLEARHGILCEALPGTATAGAPLVAPEFPDLLERGIAPRPPIVDTNARSNPRISPRRYRHDRISLERRLIAGVRVIRAVT